jgi:hypothetical protein
LWHPADGAGGIEISDNGTRRWWTLWNETTANGDDLIIGWRFSGVTDLGYSLFLRHTTGAVVVATDAGLRLEEDDGDGTIGLLLNTHRGAEGGTYDADYFEEKTKVVETNTNGNEDLVILESQHFPSDGAYWIEVRILGVEDADVTAIYVRRQVSAYLRNGGADVSFSHNVEDTGTAGGSGSWGAATAGLSIAGNDVVVRVSATDTARLNWIVLVTWGRIRALNS